MLTEEQAAMLPEDIRSDPSLSSFNDFGGLAKSYIETKKMIGNSIRLPEETAAPEDAKKWWGEVSPKLAARGFIEAPPDKPEAYEFKFDGIDDEIVKSDAVMNKFKPIAHELGLSNKQANALVARFCKDILPDLMGPVPEVIEGEAATKLLADTFKGETEKRVTAYKAFVNNLKADYPDLVDLIKDSHSTLDGKVISFFDHPTIVRLFSDMSEKFSQDSGGHIQGGGLQSVDAIKAEINTYMRDSTHENYKAYQLRKDPDAVRKVKGLFEQLARAGAKASNAGEIDTSQVAR